MSVSKIKLIHSHSLGYGKKYPLTKSFNIVMSFSPKMKTKQENMLIISNNSTSGKHLDGVDMKKVHCCILCLLSSYRKFRIYFY